MKQHQDGHSYSSSRRCYKNLQGAPETQSREQKMQECLLASDVKENKNSRYKCRFLSFDTCTTVCEMITSGETNGVKVHEYSLYYLPTFSIK